MTEQAKQTQHEQSAADPVSEAAPPDALRAELMAAEQRESSLRVQNDNDREEWRKATLVERERAESAEQLANKKADLALRLLSENALLKNDAEVAERDLADARRERDEALTETKQEREATRATYQAGYIHRQGGSGGHPRQTASFGEASNL